MCRHPCLRFSISLSSSLLPLSLSSHCRNQWVVFQCLEPWSMKGGIKNLQLLPKSPPPPPPLGGQGGCLERTRMTCSPRVPPNLPGQRAPPPPGGTMTSHVLVIPGERGVALEFYPPRKHLHRLILVHDSPSSPPHQKSCMKPCTCTICDLKMISYFRSEAPPPAPPTSQSKGLFSDEEDPILSETTPTTKPQ